MPTKHVMPTLGSEGWVNRSLTAFDNMISDFFLSEYSQSFAFKGLVASFPWIIQQYTDDLSQMCTALQDTLTKYLSTQFYDVDVQASVKLMDGSINKYALNLFVGLTDSAGETFTLARLISYAGTKVIDINKLYKEG